MSALADIIIRPYIRTSSELVPSALNIGFGNARELIPSQLVQMEKQLFTEKEIAVMLGCSSAHVKTLRLKRLIPFIKLGRLVKYKPQEVMRAIEKLTTREHEHREEKKRSLEEQKQLLRFGLEEKKRLGLLSEERFLAALKRLKS